MKKGLKLSLAAATVAALLVGCTGGGDYVAKVGKEEITEKELLSVFLSEGSGSYVVNNLIKRNLLLKEADVSDDEVAERVEEMKAEYGAKNMKELAEKTSLSESELLERARVRASEVKILKEKAKITDEEFDTYFQEYKSRLTYNSVETSSLAEAAEILELVKSGETLENASHKTLDDYHLHFNWSVEVSEFELPTEISGQLAGVAEGEVSTPIELDEKVFLYEVEQRKDASKETGYYEAFIRLAAQKGMNIEMVYTELLEGTEIKINKEYKDEINF